MEEENNGAGPGDRGQPKQWALSGGEKTTPLTARERINLARAALKRDDDGSRGGGPQ